MPMESIDRARQSPMNSGENFADLQKNEAAPSTTIQLLLVMIVPLSHNTFKTLGTR